MHIHLSAIQSLNHTDTRMIHGDTVHFVKSAIKFVVYFLGLWYRCNNVDQSGSKTWEWVNVSWRAINQPLKIYECRMFRFQKYRLAGYLSQNFSGKRKLGPKILGKRDIWYEKFRKVGYQWYCKTPHIIIVNTDLSLIYYPAYITYTLWHYVLRWDMHWT